MKTEAFNYGEYERLWSDKRTHKVLAIVEKTAKWARVEYIVVGGLAAYLHAKNPPEDYPDIDIRLQTKGTRAAAFVAALAKTKGFALRFADHDEDEVFSTFVYDGDIQVDVFTSSDTSASIAKPKRIANTWVEPVEPLIVEKLIRGSEADVRMALDLLAYCDYDKRMLAQIAREFRITGAIHHAAYFARRMAVGRISKAGLDAVVKRLASA